MPRRAMGTVSSGRQGGADAPGRGAPGGGVKASGRPQRAAVAKAHRQSNSAAAPPSSSGRDWPAAWQLEYTPTALPKPSAGTSPASPASSSGEVNALAAP